MQIVHKRSIAPSFIEVAEPPAVPPPGQSLSTCGRGNEGEGSQGETARAAAIKPAPSAAAPQKPNAQREIARAIPLAPTFP